MNALNHYYQTWCSYQNQYPALAFGTLVACNLASGYLTSKIMGIAIECIKMPSSPPKDHQDPTEYLFKGLSITALASVTYAGLNVLGIKILHINLPLWAILIPTLAIPIYLISQSPRYSKTAEGSGKNA